MTGCPTTATRRSLLPWLAAFTGGSAGWATPARAQRMVRAPEFEGIDRWLSVEAPLTIAGLRGKVVLIDFWTYSCINCRRTVPYLNRWHAEYGTAGLEVVGIHTPEFRFERAHRNVDAALRAFGIPFPVGQDNQGLTWRAWGNQAWPSFYLLDRTGRIVLAREGEGHAAELERVIRNLLGMTGSTISRSEDDPDLSGVRSPEMYFGASYRTPQDPAQSPREGETAYTFAGLARPRLDSYQLDGTWERTGEALALRSRRGAFRTTFSAAKIHLVADAPEPTTLTLRTDGGDPVRIEIARPDLYTLLDGRTYGEHELSFEAEGPGLTLYSATFG